MSYTEDGRKFYSKVLTRFANFLPLFFLLLRLNVELPDILYKRYFSKKDSTLNNRGREPTETFALDFAKV